MKKPFNLTFGVGPTQISDAVKNDMAYAAENNLLSVSHRGTEFTEISQNTITALRKLYNVPDEYHVFFTTSATDSWEVCARNLIENEAYSFACGHFSGAFAKCLTAWHKTVHENVVDWGQINNFASASIPNSVELITLCHNETSTGVTLHMQDIADLKNKYRDTLIAVDVTSSIGACTLDIPLADVWYFSIQKGLGLPSGLGVMIVGPRAMEKSRSMLKKGHPQGFFNFTNMEKRMAKGKYQTIQTPNILGIYLLGRQCERLLEQGLKKVHQKTHERAQDLYTFFENHPHTTPFVEDKNIRSPFSLCIHIGEEMLTHYTQKAAEKGVQLGGGYGALKATHMRVANYPAITDNDIQLLKDIFKV